MGRDGGPWLKRREARSNDEREKIECKKVAVCAPFYFVTLVGDV